MTNLAPHSMPTDYDRARRPLLEAAAAAELLSVPKSWVLAEARADRIPHVRLGRYVRFDADELLAWSRERHRGPRLPVWTRIRPEGPFVVPI